LHVELAIPDKLFPQHSGLSIHLDLSLCLNIIRAIEQLLPKSDRLEERLIQLVLISLKLVHKLIVHHLEVFLDFFTVFVVVKFRVQVPMNVERDRFRLFGLLDQKLRQALVQAAVNEFFISKRLAEL
jgi:hypothetical protein